jgi:16S rRNA (guanine527-N7)-methyltransferase
LNREDADFLYENARDFGIELSPMHLNRFGLFMDELLEWNRRVNLTGLSEPRRIINDLILDSLLCASLTPEDGRMLDVGSGAGFPGIVIKIYRPHLTIDLLEATSKKVHFLKQIVRLLELKEIEIIKGRLESEGGNLLRQDYDMITTRALAGLDEIIVRCSPFLSPKGRLIGFLGKNAEAILKETASSRKAHSLALLKRVDYTLPGKRFTRSIVLFGKDIHRRT